METNVFNFNNKGSTFGMYTINSNIFYCMKPYKMKVPNCALQRGLEANIALGFASRYFRLSTTPLCNISRSALAALL